MTNTWSNERIIDFINVVQSHPEVWNTESEKYKDRNGRKDGWAVIADKFGISSDEAYKKFRSLRTYANEEKKRKCGKAGGKQTKWFAFDAMSFMLTKDTTNTGLDSENSTANISVTIHPDISNDQEEIVDLETTDSSSAHSPKPRVFKKSKREDPFLGNAQNIRSDAGEKRRNEYAGFGEHIANKLSKYDDYTRSLAEFKIMKILFDCDMGVYRNQDSTAYAQNTDNNTSAGASTSKRHRNP